MCGESNATIFREAAAAGVERATFVSVHDYGFPGRPLLFVRRLAFVVYGCMLGLSLGCTAKGITLPA